jgi:hypothetical protein
MGVDCKVKLPPGVRVRDVGKVLSILSGAKVEKRSFSNFGDSGWSAHVPSLAFKDAGVEPTCTVITWIDGDQSAQGQLYHFEFSRDGSRGMMGRSYAAWIATCKRLVDFFGGEVDYQDCDDIDCDYKRESPPDFNAEDGDEWVSLQERILNCQPITDEEIEVCEEFAAYEEE